MQKEEWKTKIKRIVDDCSQELSKATVIGKKMLTASHTNAALNEKYQELGQLAAKHLRSGILEWENPRVNELLKEIEEYENQLDLMEKDVSKIKSKK
ncbi:MULTISPECIES: hypothetical protein [Halobacteriovorax]|uniref:Uncharacterized protein n=1 Tax=Halobacteriovorax vibrionivorans TaxID=2152716 RepID=A0ABY0IGH4_9BACT|nr:MULTISPECIES: hypothetical protein [Halobacteriovorax]AYF43381.1 hypothetical protein BALOs_0367 [Halobacteriovorax sp. BALOs_7]RZF22045.1 hypothetical protein DAY19_10205 [Halobacteriovorax vibrionivorans]